MALEIREKPNVSALDIALELIEILLVVLMSVWVALLLCSIGPRCTRRPVSPAALSTSTTVHLRWKMRHTVRSLCRRFYGTVVSSPLVRHTRLLDFPDA
jgi:hypothetical protein